MSILFTLNTTAPIRRTEPRKAMRFSHTQSTLSYQKVLFISSNIAALPTTTLLQAPPSNINASLTIIFSLYHFYSILRLCADALDEVDDEVRSHNVHSTVRWEGKVENISLFLLACWENTIAQVCKRSGREKCLHNIFIHAWISNHFTAVECVHDARWCDSDSRKCRIWISCSCNFSILPVWLDISTTRCVDWCCCQRQLFVIENDNFLRIPAFSQWMPCCYVIKYQYLPLWRRSS